MGYIADNFWDLMTRGGVVMWPLLALSVLGVALAFERTWFWVKMNNPGRLSRVADLTRRLCDGDVDGVRRDVARDSSVYGRVLDRMLAGRASEADAADAVESQRARLERFMPILSTIITAAPMLGILGTVLGIISSFQVLSDMSRTIDPREVGEGISEALLTTAVGLVVTIIVLLPYNLFRAQLDRTLGRFETLIAAATDAIARPEQKTARDG